MSDGSHNDTVELDVFIVNTDTKEVHHKNFATGSCQLHEITGAVIASSLADARRNLGADPCGHCFKSKK